jgi:hypothetical protein
LKSPFVPAAIMAVCAPLCMPVLAQNRSETPVLEVVGEEPTGVFFDNSSIGTQTPILFTARLKNVTPESRQVEVSWKITDANGKVRMQRSGKYPVDANGHIVRRELFDAPARGGFLLEVRAVSKQKGADAVATKAVPFAVLVAPSKNEVVGMRPRSFFVLTTPAALSGSQLDFYSRLGARVLRSNMVINASRPDWRMIENQLAERVRRNLSTIALLPIGEENSNRAEAYFSRQVPTNLANLGYLQTWELSGSVAPADLDAWSQIARSKRTDVALFAPMPSGLPSLPSGASVRLSAVDALTFGWPSQSVSHPASLRRLWLSRSIAAKNAGLNGFHVRRERDDYADLSPGDAAGSLTADYLSAIMSGASSMAESLAPASADLNGAASMSRAAAFSMLSRTLEESAFSEELFPKSPLIEGALFASRNSSTAIIYAPQGKGGMAIRIAPARAYDIFGNSISRDKNGVLEFPLSGQPVYVVTPNSTDVLSYALKNGRIDDLKPFAAQILPLSRDIESTGPNSSAVRVRLQNIGIGGRQGKIRLKAPKGWILATRDYEVTLAEGESKTFEFRVLKSAFDPKWNNQVPFEVEVSGKVGQSWKFNAPVSTAQNLPKGASLVIDGNLSDWNDAIWQTATPNEAKVTGKVAFKWDSRYLYVAARVTEASLQARRPEESTYEFWDDYDALQIAFGTDNSVEAAPARAPFRDSDRGILLSPFTQRGSQEYDGRVLKLWGPDLPYNRVADKVRWGGAINDSKCVITREEQSQITIYEAQIPWNALPEIKPNQLAQKDGSVRFGWLLHNDEGTPLDYGRSLGNFSWWENTSTFLPEGILTSALRGTLGFSLSGGASSAPANAAPVAPPALSPSGPLDLPAPPTAIRPQIEPPVLQPIPLAAPVPAPAPPPAPPAIPPAQPARLVPPVNPDVLPPASPRNPPPKEIAPFIIP